MCTHSHLHPHSFSFLLRVAAVGLLLVFPVFLAHASELDRLFPNAMQEVYSLREYGILEPQSIGQLPDGRTVVVTDSGKLFVFNGVGWELLPLTLPVGSMKVFPDSQGHLWVGGLGFFGYLDAELNYHEVSSTHFEEELDSSLTVLWFYETGDWIHCANNKTLFHLNRTTGEHKTTRFEGMFEAYHWMWDGKLHLGSRNKIEVWEGDRFVFKLPWKHEQQAFVGWEHEGHSFFLNVEFLSVFDEDKQVDTLLNPLMTMRGAAHLMTDSFLYIMTLQGVIKMHRSGECEGFYTHFYHQPVNRANIRFQMSFAGEELWFLTANSIIRTNMTVGVKTLEVEAGYPISGLWDITPFQNSLYTSSNEGLQRWNHSELKLQFLGGLSPDFETASLWPWQDQLLVSSWIELGSLDSDGYHIRRSDGSYRVFARSESPDRFWVSRDTGALQLDASFEIIREIQFTGEIISMVEFKGHLWITTLFGEVLGFDLQTDQAVYHEDSSHRQELGTRNLRRMFRQGNRLFLQRRDAILEWNQEQFVPLPLSLPNDWHWEVPQCANDSENVILVQRHAFLPGAKIGAFTASAKSDEIQWEPNLVPLRSPSGFIRNIKLLEGMQHPTVALLSQSMIEVIDLERFPNQSEAPPLPRLVKPIPHFGGAEPSPFEGIYHAQSETPLLIQMHSEENHVHTPIQFYGRLVGKSDWIRNPTGFFAFYGILRGTQTFEGYTVDAFGNRSEQIERIIRVAPPWYLSNSAIAIYVLMLMVCVFTAAQWQTRRLRDRARQLQEMVDSRTEDLVKASLAKSIFVSNVSHEIRNPLNGLLGLAQSLRVGDVLDSATLERLRRPSLYLYRFLSNVLDFSKFESGGIRFSKRVFDPNELLDSVQSMFTGDLDAREIHFISDYRFEGSPFVISSQEAIEMILVNLVGNAIKYTPGQGHIRLALQKTPSSLRFSVADSGIGISESDLQRIFEPYQQGEHPPLITGEKGAGIGLSLVQHSIQQLGGSITVRSTEGVGSTFTVTLPVAEPDSQQAPAVIDQVQLKGQFLIVEDLEYNRKLFIDLLESWGASVTGAADGAQAMQLTDSGSFDMIFMDYDLPDSTGAALTEALRKEARFKSIPIVGLSAYTDQDFIQKGLRSGMNDYLFKPLNPQQLVECLKKLIPDQIQFTQKPGSSTPSSRSSFRRFRLHADSQQPDLSERVAEFFDHVDALVGELQQCDLGSERFHSLIHQLKGLSSYIHHQPTLDYWKRLMGLSEPHQRHALLDELDQLPTIVVTMKRELQGLQILEQDYALLLAHGESTPTANQPHSPSRA